MAKINESTIELDLTDYIANAQKAMEEISKRLEAFSPGVDENEVLRDVLIGIAIDYVKLRDWQEKAGGQHGS